jgi:hypothetical protein
MPLRPDGPTSVLAHALTYAIGYGVYAAAATGATLLWTHPLEALPVLNGLAVCALFLGFVWLHRRIGSVERRIRGGAAEISSPAAGRMRPEESGSL